MRALRACCTAPVDFRWLNFESAWSLVDDVFPDWDATEEPWFPDAIERDIKSGKCILRLVDEAARNVKREHRLSDVEELFTAHDDFRRDIFLRAVDVKQFLVKQGGEIARAKLKAMRLEIAMWPNLRLPLMCPSARPGSLDTCSTCD